MSLISRITLSGPPAEDPEDFLADSLGVVFPDDITNVHGDHRHGLLYTSPHLPRPLAISLASPRGEDDRQLMSHYLWNASLQLAELIEAGTLGLPSSPPATPPHPGLGGRQGGQERRRRRSSPPPETFSVKGLSCLELGAGTGLPSLLASTLGAERVQVTDYPAPATIANLREVVGRNCVPSSSPLGTVGPVSVEGHEWGDLSSAFALENRGKFDRVFACDCLWMPWQHGNLRKSVGWFLKEGGESRAWVVAGFHTGREAMRGFFGDGELRSEGLETERMWEVDCNGAEREWVWDRGREDERERKTWLVVATLKRVTGGER
jgi:nicotinamide N-methyltransferase